MSEHIPMRMCVICRKRAPKATLARFTQAVAGAIPLPDLKRKTPGRGLYLCDQAGCREKFERRWAKRKVKGQEV